MERTGLSPGSRENVVSPGKVLCPNCKLENRRGETRCAGCGQTLPRIAGSRVAHEEESKPVAWLHCEPLPPIPVAPGKEVTIGRKEQTLVLPHTEVSRLHATVRAVAGGLEVVDEKSSNGTLVNGRAVSKAELKVGDVIKIGPYAIEVWAVKELPADDPERTGAAPLGTEPIFSGKLGSIELSEVIESVAAHKRSGTLSVVDRQQRGHVRFVDGVVTDAEWGSLQGEAAIEAMRALDFGSFAFTVG